MSRQDYCFLFIGLACAVALWLANRHSVDSDGWFR